MSIYKEDIDELIVAISGKDEWSVGGALVLVKDAVEETNAHLCDLAETATSWTPRATIALERIADALERLSPPPQTTTI